MYKKQYSNQARVRRHIRLRKKLAGTTERPRLSVFRSGDQIYAQIIDDTAQRTLLAASSRDAELAKTSSDKIAGLDGDDAPESLKGIEKNRRVRQAWLVGELVAKRAKEAGDHAGRLRSWRLHLPWAHRGAGRGRAPWWPGILGA